MSNHKIESMMKERERLLKGGGDKAISAQHESGKLTARERLDLLYDSGTFQEKGLWARHRCHDSSR